jgi:hypothetical protein
MADAVNTEAGTIEGFEIPTETHTTGGSPRRRIRRPETKRGK